MTFDSLPGSEMFEKALGPKWGVRVWKFSFLVAVALFLGASAFASIKGGIWLWQLVAGKHETAQETAAWNAALAHYEAQQATAAHTHHSFGTVTIDATRRAGPGIVLRNVGTVNGKNWDIEGHDTCVDANGVKKFEVNGQKCR